MDNVLHLLPRKPVIGHQKTLTFMREEERLLSFWGTSWIRWARIRFSSLFDEINHSVAAGNKKKRVV